MIATALVFGACSQNDDNVNNIDVNDKVEIGLRYSAIDKTTRAELKNDWFIARGNSFGVYGYKGDTQIFGNASGAEKVTWDEEESDWTHPTVRYWDKAADNYAFYAYAPYEATPTSFTDKKFKFTVNDLFNKVTKTNADIAIAAPLTDLTYTGSCFSDAEGHGKGHVEFIFHHILSKLSFKATTDVPEATGKVKIIDLRLSFPSATSATWTQTAATGTAGTTAITGFTPAETDSIDYETGSTATATELSSTTASGFGATEYIVVPCNDTVPKYENIGVRVKYNVKYKDGVEEKECYATGKFSIAPKQNDHIVVTINLKLENNKIEFCVDKVTDWTSASGTVEAN